MKNFNRLIMITLLILGSSFISITQESKINLANSNSQITPHQGDGYLALAHTGEGGAGWLCESGEGWFLSDSAG
ncbi:MAG: hypothetical protein AAFN93_20320 [Bacteroidota bacterium]